MGVQQKIEIFKNFDLADIADGSISLETEFFDYHLKPGDDVSRPDIYFDLTLHNYSANFRFQFTYAEFLILLDMVNLFSKDYEKIITDINTEKGTKKK